MTSSSHAVGKEDTQQPVDNRCWSEVLSAPSGQAAASSDPLTTAAPQPAETMTRSSNAVGKDDTQQPVADWSAVLRAPSGRAAASSDPVTTAASQPAVEGISCGGALLCPAELPVEAPYRHIGFRNDSQDAVGGTVQVPLTSGPVQRAETMTRSSNAGGKDVTQQPVVDLPAALSARASQAAASSDPLTSGVSQPAVDVKKRNTNMSSDSDDQVGEDTVYRGV